MNIVCYQYKIIHVEGKSYDVFYKPNNYFNGKPVRHFVYLYIPIAAWKIKTLHKKQ